MAWPLWLRCIWEFLCVVATVALPWSSSYAKKWYIITFGIKLTPFLFDRHTHAPHQPFLDPGQDDGPRFGIRTSSIATFIVIVLLCRLVLTPQLSWKKHSPAPFAFARRRDIVHQHMPDMEQGASMGRVELLMTAFHSIAQWFG